MGGAISPGGGETEPETGERQGLASLRGVPLLWGLGDAPFPPLPSAAARIKASRLHKPTFHLDPTGSNLPEIGFPLSAFPPFPRGRDR